MVFDWAQQISTRENAQAPDVELGPCMLLGGMEELPLRRGAERLRRLFDPLAITQQRR